MHYGRFIQGKDDLKDVNASEIVAKIGKGETVDLDHARILGDLNIGKLNLPNRSIRRTDLETKSLGLEDSISIIASIIKITNSEIQGVTNFGEAAFSQEFDFSGSRFKDIADFRGSKFDGPTDFTGTQFSEEALFSGTQFTGGALFEGCLFDGWADFLGFRVIGHAQFRRCQFNKRADFLRSRFSGYTVDFSESEFRGQTIFRRSMFCEDTYFCRCVFIGDLDFSGSQFKGDVLTFKHSEFSKPKSQEDACRRAKNISEKNGDREEAGYHFDREMDARRRQRPWYLRYPELVFIQMIFGYGVHPWRLMTWWGIIVTSFAFLFWVAKGIEGATIFDCIKFSFATAIAPGYIASVINPGNSGYRLVSEYHALAMAETIIGTFLWAGFIATFARKYMK